MINYHYISSGYSDSEEVEIESTEDPTEPALIRLKCDGVSVTVSLSHEEIDAIIDRLLLIKRNSDKKRMAQAIRTAKWETFADATQVVFKAAKSCSNAPQPMIDSIFKALREARDKDR